MDEYMIDSLMNGLAKSWLNYRYGISALKKQRTENPIEKVIFNPPATIVFWKSGEKTVVQARGDDEFNPEIGLAMAISKYYLCDICGLKRYDGIFKKYIPEEKISTGHAAANNDLVKALGDAFISGVDEVLRPVIIDPIFK